MRALRVPGNVSNRVSGERRWTKRDKVRSSSDSSAEQLVCFTFYEFTKRGVTCSPAQQSPDALHKIPSISKLLHSPLFHPINNAALSCRKQLCPQHRLVLRCCFCTFTWFFVENFIKMLCYVMLCK